MYSAIGVEPTKLTAWMAGWSRMASTAALSPCTTLNTPSGRPASFSSRACSSEAEGSRSEGLSTKVLPQAIATGNIHIGTITGKLNGVMPATTPSGWRIDQASMPRAIWSVNSPLSNCGMPTANSTTSMPRATSPCASLKVLPCSRVTSAAKSSVCCWHSCRYLNSTRARASGGVADQAGKALLAANALELDAGHQAHGPDVDHVRQSAQRVHRVFPVGLHALRVLEDALLLEHFERRDAGRAGQRVAGIGVAVRQLDARRRIHEG